MDIAKLKNVLELRQEPQFRVSQITGPMLRQGVASFLDIKNIPLELRKALISEVPFLSCEPVKVLSAHDGRAHKAVLKLHDGALIETVFMAPKVGEWSACVSCQVGCAMRCSFCATGDMGFKRNLTPEEITDQVLFWRQYKLKNNIKGEFTHIVYMGMGEPFNNWPAVKQSLKHLLDPELFGFGSRGIAVSTSGLVHTIADFVKEFPQVNLAISLHFATDAKRSAYMPVNKAFNLEKLKLALQDYFKVSKRKVFIEYLMLNGVNDTSEDAQLLAAYLKSIGPGHLLHLNLIPYNTTGAGLQSTAHTAIQSFRAALRVHGFHVTIRRSLGQEIYGACGQLSTTENAHGK